MTPESTAAATAGPVARRGHPVFWLLALVPLLLLGGLLVWITHHGPAEVIRGAHYPPVERLVFQQVQLDAEGIRATVLNDGPEPVTIGQVQVDEAFWTFTSSRSRTLAPLDRTVLAIPYPWVFGDAHTVRVITSTGATFDHEIAVAVPTPPLSARMLGIFALIGLYVGVIPVAIGLLWYPVVRRLGDAGLRFVLALTVGLLLFLLVDAGGDAAEALAAVPESYQGLILLVFAAAGAYLGIEAFGRWLDRPRTGRRAAGTPETGERAWVLALLVAVGIGLHNLAEGLAIGAAFSLGEMALGTLLIVGFALHNTTEGLAIVAPLARSGRRIGLGALVQLGLIAGVPTILGAWLGGLQYSAAWSVVFLAVGVGAIAQVVVQILGQMAGQGRWHELLARPATLSGLAAGVAIMYVTGMLVG